MGIPGLLKELNALVGRDGHISAYRGQRVAVDASGWLHRSTYGCALDLLLGVPTTAYLTVLRTLLLTLLDHSVVPILVFDGAHLPAKAATTQQREAHRMHHRTLALQYHAQHNAELAQVHAQKAVAPTPAMTAAFLSLCRSSGVDCVVAPYEADAQLALLVQSQSVHACITEDSDLIPFGCDRLFIKLDRSGAGREVVVTDLAHTATVDPFSRRLKSVYLEGGLLGLCVLSGCDYLPSLRGMGVRTAAKWWSEWKCIEMIVHQLKKAKGKRKIPSKGRSRSRTPGSGKKRRGGETDRDEGKEGVTTIVSERLDGGREDDDRGAAEEEDEAEMKVNSDDESSENVGKEELYDDYPLHFHKAILTFRHMLVIHRSHHRPLPERCVSIIRRLTLSRCCFGVCQVYDPQEARYRHLNKLPAELEHLSPLESTSLASLSPATSSSSSSLLDSSLSLSSRLSNESKHNARLTSLDFLGLPPPSHLTPQLVSGKLNPKTLQPFVTEDPTILTFFTERLRPPTQGARTEGGREGIDEGGGVAKGVDRERVLSELDEMLGAGSWQCATTPLQRLETESTAALGSEWVGEGGAELEKGREKAEVKPKVVVRAKLKTKAEVERERRGKEETRSTGGGLRRFFSSSATPPG